MVYLVNITIKIDKQARQYHETLLVTVTCTCLQNENRVSARMTVLLRFPDKIDQLETCKIQKVTDLFLNEIATLTLYAR